MLGGITSYGSDSESEDETRQSPPPTRTAASLPAPQEPAAKATGSISSSLGLPPPKKRRDGPVRITVEAPKFDDDEEERERQSKKPRTVPAVSATKGAGSSSLFSALPAPKNATPVAPEPKRVLGGGGGFALNFSNAATVTATSTDASAGENTKSTSNGLFLPPSMAKAKAKAPAPVIESAPAVDFFSLGSSSNTPSSSSTPTPSIPQSSSITLVSAPEVKDFVPPTPTLFDPYPGYYQMPSGEWAAHDPVYYKKVMNQLITGVDPQADTQSKSESREFAGTSTGDMATFDPSEELRKGQLAELEKRKAISKVPTNALAAPRMNVQKATGLARSRHQLSTLLSEAYTNREALEERIAQGKRNRKEAGSKYGF